MKTLQIIGLIVLASIAQVSFFFSSFGSFGLNIVLVLAWIMLGRGKKADAFIFAFASGLAIDLLRLEGLGITSFILVLPMLAYFLIDSAVHIKDTFVKYPVFLFAIFLSNILLVILNSIALGTIGLEAELFANVLKVTALEWFIVTLSLVLAEAFFPQKANYFAK